MEQIIHYPSLKTILMVERVLRTTEVMINREELKRRLPNKIMHQTLNIILDYMHKRGLITDNSNGLLWVYNPSPKLKREINKGRGM